MMDLSKSYEFFQPDLDESTCSIVGVGSVGSTIAENLSRCGVKNIKLFDFDTVESHNIVNQMFTHEMIGKKKVDAMKEILTKINPDINVQTKPEGWNGEKLSGYVFLAVDNIDLRREICQKFFDNPFIKAVFDVRTMLTGAQSFCAKWNDKRQKEVLLDSMNFTHEEAQKDVPVSACGVVLGVATTVRIISALCVNNYIKVVKGEKPWKFVQFDGFSGILECYE